MKRAFVRPLLSLLSIKQLAQVLREGKESVKSEDSSYLKLLSVDFEQSSILPIPIHQVLLLVLQCIVRMMNDLPSDRQALIDCHLVLRLQMIFTDLTWLQMASDDDNSDGDGDNETGRSEVNTNTNTNTNTNINTTETKIDSEIMHVRQTILMAIADILMLCFSSSSLTMIEKVDVELSTSNIMEEVRKTIAFLLPTQLPDTIESASSNPKEECLTGLMSSPLLTFVHKVIQYCPLTQQQMMITKEWVLVLTRYCEVASNSEKYCKEDIYSVIQRWLIEGKYLDLSFFLHSFYCTQSLY